QSESGAPEPILPRADREPRLIDPGRQADPLLSFLFDIAKTVGDLLLARRPIDVRGRILRLRVASRDGGAALVGSRVPADESERQTAESNRQASRANYRV